MAVVARTVTGLVIIGITFLVFWLTGDMEAFSDRAELTGQGGKYNLPWFYLIPLLIGGWMATAPIRYALWGEGSKRS